MCLLSVVFIVDVISAQGNINTYFSRTISYYKFLPFVLDPLKIERNHFSLKSEYSAPNYYTLNPMSLLTKIKRDTQLGIDGNTFVTYQRYENNDILIPATVSIEYYRKNKVIIQREKLLKDQIVSNFKSNVPTEMDFGNRTSI